MLVINRKFGQVVIVGRGDREIRVKVERCKGDRCRLVFDGPRNVPIVRAEVRDRMAGEGAREGAEDHCNSEGVA